MGERSEKEKIVFVGPADRISQEGARCQKNRLEKNC